MAGIAAGKWVLSKRFVENSWKLEKWDKPHKYVVDPAVLFHNQYWKINKTGYFQNITASILLLVMMPKLFENMNLNHFLGGEETHSISKNIISRRRAYQ